MKVLLAQMPPAPRDTPPYDVALCCANLRREGYEIVVLDSNNELYHRVFKQRPYWKFRTASHQEDPSHALANERPELFEEEARRILAARPDAVVFRVENGLSNAMEVARLLKGLAPSLPLVSSGAQNPDRDAVSVWKKTWDFNDEGEFVLPFDVHILGEDELVLPKVLDALGSGRRSALAALFDKSGKTIDAVTKSVVGNLDDLPFYDFTDFDFSRYSYPTMMRINVSRSCVKRCAFCIDWIAVRKFRCLSGDRWFEEYQCQLKRHPHLFHIRHYDRLLNGDPAALSRFCDRMIARYPGRPPIIWGGDCVITEEMTGELVERMGRAGCVNLGVGFESGSERVRAAMDKGFFDNAMAERFLRACRRAKIEATLNILIGFPAETRADLEESIRFVEEHQSDIFEIRVTFPTLQVPPGSALALAPERYRLSEARGESSLHGDRWVSADGENDYEERVERFRLFCERMVERGVRLAVNRRLVKNAAAVRLLVSEISRPPAQGGVGATRSPLGQAQSRMREYYGRPPKEVLTGAEGLLAELGGFAPACAWLSAAAGDAALALGDAARARDHYERAAGVGEGRIVLRAKVKLLRLSAQRGEWAVVAEGARALLPQAEKPGPASWLRLLLGEALVHLGQEERGEAVLQELVQRYPDPMSEPYFLARLALAKRLSRSRTAEGERFREALLDEFGERPEREARIRGEA